jgi:hypothetical protein
MKTIALILATLLLTACSIKTATPKLFKADEYMVVTYSSQGCFHHTSNELVFHENNVTIYTTINEWNKKIAKTKMGTLALTQKDKEGLNKLFVYYDGKLSSGCTSVDNIEIKRYKKEVLISSKNIRDASCGQDDRDNVLSFRELIYRVTEKK